MNLLFSELSANLETQVMAFETKVGMPTNEYYERTIAPPLHNMIVKEKDFKAEKELSDELKNFDSPDLESLQNYERILQRG